MPSDPPVDAGDIPQRQFNTARRGLDPGEVRAYLHQVSETVASLQREVERERVRAEVAERRATEVEQLDPQRMVELLGQETTRVLDTARDAARDIRAKAEASAERLISEANEQAHERLAQAEAEMLEERSKMLAEVDELRSQASGELERRRAEAELMVDEMRREAQLAADGLRQEGEKDRAKAVTDAEDLREAARDEARRMVAEAATMRKQVLRDLDRRRRTAREHLERLNGARGRLLAAYQVVRRTVDEATGELTTALPEAKAESDAAMRRARSVPEASLEELESDVTMARYAGLLPPRPDTSDLDAVLDPPGDDVEGRPDRSEASDVQLDIAAAPTSSPEDDRSDSFEVQLDIAVAAHELVVDWQDEPVYQPELVAGGEADGPGDPDDVTVDGSGEAGEELVDAAELATVDDPGFADDVPVDAVDAVFARLKGGVVGAPSDDVLLRQRDETVEPLERALSRRLKRVLADEQNEVLDLVRRGKAVEEDELLPDPSAHADRYGDIAADELHTAAYWGAAAVEGQLSTSCEALIQELGRELALPLRERVLSSVAEADGDAEELTTRLRTLYREWKGQWVGDTVRHFVAAAYAQGAYDAADPEAELRWVVDPECASCPDAEKNALASPLPKGEAFPTGHRAPPAHPGCRCLAMPATTDVVVTPVGATWAE